MKQVVMSKKGPAVGLTVLASPHCKDRNLRTSWTHEVNWKDLFSQWSERYLERGLGAFGKFRAYFVCCGCGERKRTGRDVDD